MHDTARRNALWGATIVAECVARGIDRFFVAPGSRCTPLTLAIADRPDVQVLRHYDERGLAFAAMGYARASGRPGAFVCTSGTAVANALPAVTEAFEDGIPMLLLTADRPAELRGTGANQTIDQVRIFGPRAWFHDLPTPAPDDPVNDLQHIVHGAIDAARLGPAHLNCQFRKPLHGAGTPVIGTPLETEPETPPAPLKLPGRRGVFLLGPCFGRAGIRETLRERSRWPVIENESALASSAVRNMLRPDVVIHIGGRTVLRHTEEALAEWGAPLVRITPAPPSNPAGLDCTHVARAPHTLAGNLEPTDGLADDDRRERWDEEAARAAKLPLSTDDSLNELSATRAVCQRLAEDEALHLYVGNSLPARLVHYAGTVSQDRIAMNRGASGIDGLVASAAGHDFHRAPGTTILLLGDLSLLHDLNSLPLAARRGLTIVVLNNDGGGIFHRLPIRSHPGFESWFGTPHGHRFEPAAGMFGLEYHRPDNLEAFSRILRQRTEQPGGALIEVTADRHATDHLLTGLVGRLEGL